MRNFLLDIGLKEGDSAMLAAYDPPFMKKCVRPEQIASRISPSILRQAYRRAAARCDRRIDQQCAYDLAKECTKRVPRTVGDTGPPCFGRRSAGTSTAAAPGLPAHLSVYKTLTHFVSFGKNM